MYVQTPTYLELIDIAGINALLFELVFLGLILFMLAAPGFKPS